MLRSCARVLVSTSPKARYIPHDSEVVYSTSIAGILRTVYTPGALEIEDFTCEFSRKEPGICLRAANELTRSHRDRDGLYDMESVSGTATESSPPSNKIYSVELPLSIIVGCLPTLRPLLAKVLEMRTSQRGRSGYRVQDDSRQMANLKGKSAPKNSTASTDDEARLYHDAHSIVKKTTWVVEQQV